MLQWIFWEPQLGVVEGGKVKYKQYIPTCYILEGHSKEWYFHDIWLIADPNIIKTYEKFGNFQNIVSETQTLHRTVKVIVVPIVSVPPGTIKEKYFFLPSNDANIKLVRCIQLTKNDGSASLCSLESQS